MNRQSSLVGTDGGKRRVDSRCVADGKANTVIDQIMLRFRPIAPRPLTSESSGYVLPMNGLKKKRVKRKYVRVKKTTNKAGDCNLSIKDNKILSNLSRTVANELVVADPSQQASNWISFDLTGNKREDLMNSFVISKPAEKFSSDLHGGDLASAVNHRKVADSWITMESVTGTCEDRRLIGYTDNEIWKNLETDSCPGFISNCFDEVLWVNPAYRRMLDPNPDGGAPASEVVVRLVVKVEKSTVVKHLPAFSCRVRIEYRSSEKRTRMTVPCDVCKMDSGGFAWLLDVRLALSLGPLK